MRFKKNNQKSCTQMENLFLAYINFFQKLAHMIGKFGILKHVIASNKNGTHKDNFQTWHT